MERAQRCFGRIPPPPLPFRDVFIARLSVSACTNEKCREHEISMGWSMGAVRPVPRPFNRPLLISAILIHVIRNKFRDFEISRCAERRLDFPANEKKRERKGQGTTAPPHTSLISFRNYLIFRRVRPSSSKRILIARAIRSPKRFFSLFERETCFQGRRINNRLASYNLGVTLRARA